MSAEPAPTPFDRLRARTLILGLLGLAMLAAVPLAGAGPGGMLWVANLLYLVSLGYAVWLARRRGVDLSRLLGPRLSFRETLRVLAVVPAFTALNWGAAWLVFYPLSLVSPEFVRGWLENMDRAFPRAEGLLDWSLLLVSLVIVAPVVEEFVFRGLLLHRWSRKWGLVRGVLASTAAFAVLHFSPVGIFLLGLGLTAIYLRTGSLRLAIAAHGLNNFLAIAVTPLLMPGWETADDPLIGFQRALPGGIAALAGGLVAAVLLRDRYWPCRGARLPYDLGSVDQSGMPVSTDRRDDQGKEERVTSEIATLAGGCFWCLEAAFEQLAGIGRVVSGYAGGRVSDPTYEQVCSGTTGHAEVVQIHFDPAVISYRQLLDVFFTIHDPTTLNRQGPDVGSQYRSAIFYHSPEQREVATQALKELGSANLWDQPFVTELVPLEKFFPAEGYHQGYFGRNASQPYCAAVVAPKVAKVRAKYFERLRRS